MSFDWRTEEDEGWQEETKASDTAVAKPLWRSRWWVGLILFLGLVALWFVVQRQIDQRVTAAAGGIEAELLNTHNFVLQTAVAQDEMLFRANLSGRDRGWGEVQKGLVTEGLLLGRPMFGWRHQTEQTTLSVDDLSIELSPDLRAAELVYPQTYLVQTPAGITETIMLQQTAVYRQGSSRWLYAPPEDEEFWGDWVTNSGGLVTLVYPQRDAAVAEQLAADLDLLVEADV